MNYAVIMAGGSGKRLWPLSRKDRPKQVLNLLDGETLLHKCYQRLEGIFKPENVIVLTNINFLETVREELIELPAKNIIAEPAVRDTASAIGLAASIINNYDENANMLIVTADQILKPTDKFHEAINTAFSFTNQQPDALVTFGIKPEFASTQLGYIKFVKSQELNSVYRIESFKEKPDLNTAEKYCEDKSYYWNSGLFVWRCDTILNNLKEYVPDCIEPLEEITNGWGTPRQEELLNEWFPRLPKISIDYAVMENSDNVYGIPLDCQWYDLGSFRALRDILDADENGNINISENTEFLDSSRNIIVDEDKEHLLAMIGVEDMIVVNCSDATLVCPVPQADRLKELLQKIEQNKKAEGFL